MLPLRCRSLAASAVFHCCARCAQPHGALEGESIAKWIIRVSHSRLSARSGIAGEHRPQLASMPARGGWTNLETEVRPPTRVGVPDRWTKRKITCAPWGHGPAHPAFVSCALVSSAPTPQFSLLSRPLCCHLDGRARLRLARAKSGCGND